MDYSRDRFFGGLGLRVLSCALVLLSVGSESFRNRDHLSVFCNACAVSAYGCRVGFDNCEKEKPIPGNSGFDSFCRSTSLYSGRFSRRLSGLRLAAGSCLSMAAHAEVRTSAGMYLVNTRRRIVGVVVLDDPSKYLKNETA